MNQTSLYEMKQSIVNVVSDYVDLEAEELVEVNISMDVALGTVYSVAMPVQEERGLAVGDSSAHCRPCRGAPPLHDRRKHE